ncbi:MAG: hypothetical protein ABI452_01455 [Candidatus Limnocylindrales bacterium]
MDADVTTKRSRVLILGGDGYLGWQQALYLSSRGFDVTIVDRFAKDEWEGSWASHH